MYSLNISVYWWWLTRVTWFLRCSYRIFTAVAAFRLLTSNFILSCCLSSIFQIHTPPSPLLVYVISQLSSWSSFIYFTYRTIPTYRLPTTTKSDVTVPLQSIFLHIIQRICSHYYSLSTFQIPYYIQFGKLTIPSPLFYLCNV